MCGGPCRDVAGDSSLDCSELVGDLAEAHDQETLPDATEAGHHSATIQQPGCAHVGPFDADSGLLDFREHLKQQGVDAEAAEYINKSWRDSTKKKYGVYVRKWFKYCQERQWQPYQFSVN